MVDENRWVVESLSTAFPWVAFEAFPNAGLLDVCRGCVLGLRTRVLRALKCRKTRPNLSQAIPLFAIEMMDRFCFEFRKLFLAEISPVFR